MKVCKYIFILPFFCWAFNALAQDQAPAQGPMPQQWQLSLDVIKSKAQTLMIENNGLQIEYKQLAGQVQQLQQAIYDQQYKNKQMGRFIEERHGQTDQQVRIEELKQTINSKKQQAKTYERQLNNLQKKQSSMDHSIQQLKYTISDIELHQQAEPKQKPTVPNIQQSQEDDQLTQLHKQLEDQTRQEVILQNELNDLKTGSKAKNLDVDALESENKQLEARRDVLLLQKLHHERKSSDVARVQINRRKYEQLKERRDQLEAGISAYESRLDELRETSLMAISWPLKRKRLIHEMVQVDARNNQMRDKIKDLREDIDVLKDQVAKLERRIDFVNGQSAK